MDDDYLVLGLLKWYVIFFLFGINRNWVSFIRLLAIMENTRVETRKITISSISQKITGTDILQFSRKIGMFIKHHVDKHQMFIKPSTFYLFSVIFSPVLSLQIHSDCAANQQVTYRISGVGIDQPPYGIFIINQKTGEINITSIVDREITPFFIVSWLHTNICVKP